MIQKHYLELPQKIQQIRSKIGRPLTLTEKILYSHLWANQIEEQKRGESYVDFAPDRVAMQDAT
ncbi:MAG: hypothetical protein VXX63_03085, partial [Bacteroidota bacterium]|nr:hypothetical protein [Bacteroidota bacterium]